MSKHDTFLSNSMFNKYKSIDVNIVKNSNSKFDEKLVNFCRISLVINKYVNVSVLF